MKKQKNLTEQTNSLGALLRTPFEALLHEVYSRLAQQGFEELRPAHGVVFRYIAPEGSRVTELAARAQMTKQSMSYLVDYLCQHGYASMQSDPIDGRAKCVLLTERGLAAQQAALNISQEIEQAWAGRIGREEMRQLRQLLETLSTCLHQDNMSATNEERSHSASGKQKQPAI